MNALEKIVPSRETCKELNFKGYTALVWVKYKSQHSGNVRFILMLNEEDLPTAFSKMKCVFDKCEILEIIPAPNTDEIIEELVEKTKLEIETSSYMHGDCTVYESTIDGIDVNGNGLFKFFGDVKKLSEALAKLYMWCEEEGYLK